MRVAIQGQTGSFHHEAAKQWFDRAIEIVPAESFEGVFKTLDNHAADMAVVAIENALYGSITQVLDLLEAHSFHIIGEVYLPIEQHLIALPAAALNTIKAVYSHPVALAQCKRYLDTHLPHAKRIEYSDTAASVEYVKMQNDPTNAAIAGRTAAQLHNLPILTENIEDNKANVTRFLVLSPKPPTISHTNKASLVITTPHIPGALAHVLTTFANNHLNLTKLESRPIIGQPWHYRFYIDIEARSEQLTHVLQAINQKDVSVRILGQYASAKD